jgi:hypothetical protein
MFCLLQGKRDMGGMQAYYPLGPGLVHSVLQFSIGVGKTFPKDAPYQAQLEALCFPGLYDNSPGVHNGSTLMVEGFRIDTLVAGQRDEMNWEC